MSIQDAINHLYYNMTLNELRSLNENTLYPNITYNSLLYLDLISFKENCTASYLAEALRISKPAVTAKINELIRQGLVVKNQSESDRRVYYISLSPEVKADYLEYNQKLYKAIKKVETGYHSEQLSMVTEMILQLSKCYMDEE